MTQVSMTKSELLEEIRACAGGAAAGINMDSPFIDSLKEKIDDTEIIIKDSLSGNRDSNIMRQVIGKGGYYFHLTTKNTNCHFIWYDRHNNKIYIWGNSESVEKAKGVLNHRLRVVKARNETINDISQ